ncbi:MAG: nitrous oxide reductase family maturation protein NosD [Elusimicrobia bacterium]|nr:nitrous oxide reductase family maturation protein NosD [Elusimicrobiota bacterium]
MAVARLARLLALAGALSGPAWGSELQDLIDQAEPGSVVELAPGVHRGPVAIGKPLTLRGGGRAAVLGGGRGTVVTITAPGVSIDGLRIEGSGESLLTEDAGVRVEAASAAIRGCVLEDVLFGVFLVHAPGALIEGNRLRGKSLDIGRRGDLIRSWNSDRVIARGNILEGGRDFVLWFSTGSRVEGNVITGGRYGLHFMYTNGASVAGNRFTGNSVGLYLMYSQRVAIRGNRFERHRGPSGAGLGLKESDWVSVEENDFAGNRQGIYIDGSPTVAERGNVFSRNLLSRNDIGISMLPGISGNLFYDNAFDDNIQQVSKRGGGQIAGNEWRRGGRGNYWSDYAGYGLSGSEVGRLAYRAESAWQSLTDRRPLARFFLFTPAAQAVDAASRAFPVFRPKAVLVDESPLLRPPMDLRRASDPIEAAWGLPLGLASLSGLLLGLPALLRTRSKTRGKSSPRGVPVEIKGLSKSFGKRDVLKGVDLSLSPGETVVLWGANGTGKSTLIKCLLGLHDYKGEIRIFGRDARSEGHLARADLGYVAQEFAGYDWTVGQAMAFVARLRQLEPARIEPSLEACGLRGEGGKRVCDLSGGMKQKLALAMALLANPPLLVLDEPCSNLDAASRGDLLGILRGLKGRSIIMTTHRLSEVKALADRVLCLEEGSAPRALGREDFLMSASEFGAEAAV